MSEPQKISIRFFNDREVRALWDERNAKWWFSVLDIVAVLTNQDDYTKTRNYWKYLKTKLKKEGHQVVSATTQLKILAPDGKRRLSDMLDYEGIIALGKTFPSTKANRFIEWFTYSDESIDGKSKNKVSPRPTPYCPSLKESYPLRQKRYVRKKVCWTPCIRFC
jgi:cell filamentation protein